MSRKKKSLVLLGLLLAIVILALVALPLWFPWVLPSILQKFGARYSGYERDGYSRFILYDVRFAKGKTQFHAAQIEVLFPTTFLWRNFKDDRSENYLRVSNWNLTFISATNARAPGTNSAFQLSQKLDTVLEELNRWIPKATFDKGEIRAANRSFAIPVAEWASGNLSGRISSDEILPETFFHAVLGGKPKKTLLLESPAFDFGGEIAVAREDEKALQINGGFLWHSNHINFAAQFAPKDRLPSTASVKAESFRVPAEKINLDGYRDLTGSLDLEWRTNQFTIDLSARAQPRRTRRNFLSPLTAAVHARGDTQSVRIETAKISSAWLSASLSKNAEFSFRGELLSSNAAFHVAANLAGQHWIDARGKLSGEAFLRPGKDRFPDATFNFSGADLDIRDVAMDRLNLRGEFEWPWLRVDSARVLFKEGATATAQARYNAAAREIAAGQLKLDGAIGQKFLPPEISYQTMSLAAEISGALTNLAHSGHLELQAAKFPNIAPLGLAADWRGQQFDIRELRAAISSKTSSIHVEGSASLGTNQILTSIEQLTLKKKDTAILSLEKPFAISCSSATNHGWALSIEPLRWSGNETEISLAGKVQWPASGTFSTSVRQVAFARFNDFFERPLPEAFIDRLKFSAGWTNGPATFSIDGLARFFADDNTPFSIALRTGGDKNGIFVQKAEVGSPGESIVSGKGFLPLAIAPANGTNALEILANQKIDFQAQTVPNSAFWEELASWTQTRFKEPRLTLSVAGTLNAPTGQFRASVKEILLQPKDPTQPMPRLQNFLADFDLDRQRITLNRAEVFVEGQPIIASGQLPLPKKFPANWKKIFDWRKADAELKIVDAQIAPFERLFPKILSPLGTVNLDLAMSGGKLDGQLRVANAALRPIPSLGPVHDIEATMNFRGERVTLENFSGNIGGQPVAVTGEMNLAQRRTNRLPDFAFRLRGTNVPLSRSPDLILRSDLDLAVSNSGKGVPEISGKLKLRDSFYLSDLKMLVPGKVAKPKQRPPYFSIEAQPFANWQLDVAVSGTNFLKVRSPLFRGELSANLKLDGTLREPIALGEMKIDSGVIQFPFANLRVNQGFVSLTSENPFRPRLTLAASARTYGYDVKMDVSGFADKPVIEFSSNPGLTSEQILLMVTAGELPRDELNFSTQQKAGRLAFFLGKNLISKFGATEARDDKLEIRSGENISEQGRQTYYIEYKLTDDWSIIGEYDRFGGLNAGFKWKFYEK